MIRFNDVLFSLPLVAATALASTSARADWKDLGPSPITSNANGGRITSLAPHPTDDDIVYIGAATGGVWKWNGSNCELLTKTLPSAAIGAVAVDPNDPSKIYAGSGEATYSGASYYGSGFYRSVDGGETWTVHATDTFGGRSFSRILVSPSDGNELLAAIMGATAKGHPGADGTLGVFRSSDGGQTWEPVSGLPAIAASDLERDPQDPDTLYAGMAGHENTSGIYKSTDGGTSWTKLAGGLPSDAGRIAMAISPPMTTRLYALLTHERNGTPGVYRSDDSGATWQKYTPADFGTYDWYAVSLAADPDDADTVIIGGIQISRSTNAGQSFQRVTSIHPDTQALEYDASGRLLAGVDGGLHASSNNGGSWTSWSEGLGIIQFYPGVARRPSSAEFFIGGTQDNGTLARANDGSWRMVLGGDGGYCAVHPDQPNVVFAEYYSTANIYRASDANLNFQHVGQSIDSNDRTPWMAVFVFKPDSPSTLFYGTQRLWKTTNTGNSWSAVTGDLTGGEGAIVAISISPTDTDRMYVSTNSGRLLRSDDGGNNFDVKLDNQSFPRSASTHLKVSDWDPDTVFVTVPVFGQDHVKVSRDGGDNWEVIDGDLIDYPVNTIEAFRLSDDTEILLAGSDHGTYVTCNTDGHWRKLEGEVDDTHIYDLIYEADDERLLVSTFGRGAWVMDADEAFWLDICADTGDDDDDDDTGDDDDGDDDDGDDDDGDDDDGDDDDGDDDDGDDDDGDDDDGDDDDGDDDDDDDNGNDDDDDDDDDDADDDSDDDSHGSNSDDGGCGCSAGSTLGGGLTGWALLLGLASRRRRRLD